MGRPKEHNDKTREALLDKAEALLAEGGLSAISVRSVAEQAGTTTRAVYSTCGGKDGLIAGLVARGHTILAELVRSIRDSDAPGKDLIAVGVQGFRTFALQRPQLFRLTFENVPPDALTVPDVQKSTANSYGALIHFVERAQVAGVLDNRPVAEIAFAFHALCQGMASGELSREPPPVGANFWQPIQGLDGEQLWRQSLESLVRGLAPR